MRFHFVSEREHCKMLMYLFTLAPFIQIAGSFVITSVCTHVLGMHKSDHSLSGPLCLAWFVFHVGFFFFMQIKREEEHRKNKAASPPLPPPPMTTKEMWYNTTSFGTTDVRRVTSKKPALKRPKTKYTYSTKYRRVDPFWYMNEYLPYLRQLPKPPLPPPPPQETIRYKKPEGLHQVTDSYWEALPSDLQLSWASLYGFDGDMEVLGVEMKSTNEQTGLIDDSRGPSGP